MPDDAEWEALVGSAFDTDWGAMTLTEVDRRSEQSFSLVFHGPADGTRDQGIHQVFNEQTGTLDVFLVPIGATDDRVEYEAVFNRGPHSTS